MEDAAWPSLFAKAISRRRRAIRSIGEIPDFYNEESLFKEMERVFDICHGCRRCVSLCQSFPTLFDLVDNSESLEVDGVAKADYAKVVDQCYLCDLCYMTKCPYVPPHDWDLDFPHLMLRAKAVAYQKGETKLRDKILTSTDAMGAALANPVLAPAVNFVNKVALARKALQSVAGIHADAWLPEYASTPLRAPAGGLPIDGAAEPAGRTKGKVALFATCYINRNEPGPGEDLVAVYQHNGIPVMLTPKEKCCGMPKLELGDLEAVRARQGVQYSRAGEAGGRGFDLTALVPSCVLMFKQELPLMFPDDADVLKVKNGLFRPVRISHPAPQEGKLKTDFKQGLGKVSYHAACHQRVQNIGPKTRELLSLDSRHEGRHDRALLRPRRNLCDQGGISRVWR